MKTGGDSASGASFEGRRARPSDDGGRDGRTTTGRRLDDGATSASWRASLSRDAQRSKGRWRRRLGGRATEVGYGEGWWSGKAKGDEIGDVLRGLAPGLLRPPAREATTEGGGGEKIRWSSG
ncbi:uncharacterized protein J3R85_013004 [Psidium guajava]|nr:uncharacterized protein J3R85_013004 [Psidium guajava]